MTPAEAKAQLDNQVREIIQWHFSPETGCQFWLDWAQKNFDPRGVVNSYDDIIAKFGHFQDEYLRDLQPEVWVPKAFAGKPFNIFETGGTTGMPKQRVGWNDFRVDYEEFSHKLKDEHFPKGQSWIMVGPTGPRRLRLAVEHLANYRGDSCYFVDLDPRFVKRLIGTGEMAMARKYQEHVIDQAATIIRHRKITNMFTTPRLLENLAERMSLVKAGLKGVFVGGTTMTPQYVRFVVEEVLEGKINFAPTYGNTLMGLAISKKLEPKDNYSITYYAPQPRATLRIVNPDKPEELVPYDTYGRVELTTMTKEFFVPRFLERDEAIRRPPCDEFPWDGVRDVRPFQSLTKTIIEGVY
jgi:phenylacetate-coenzyme A ligase PaaK-like adenylate-forming protein